MRDDLAKAVRVGHRLDVAGNTTGNGSHDAGGIPVLTRCPCPGNDARGSGRASHAVQVFRALDDRRGAGGAVNERADDALLGAVLADGYAVADAGAVDAVDVPGVRDGNGRAGLPAGDRDDRRVVVDEA